MNTQNYTVDEQIYALACNIRNEVAKKKIGALKAKGDSKENTLNRPCVFHNRKTQSNTGVN